jgi:hypothetical protein
MIEALTDTSTAYFRQSNHCRYYHQIIEPGWACEKWSDLDPRRYEPSARVITREFCASEGSSLEDHFRI